MDFSLKTFQRGDLIERFCRGIGWRTDVGDFGSERWNRYKDGQEAVYHFLKQVCKEWMEWDKENNGSHKILSNVVDRFESCAMVSILREIVSEHWVQRRFVEELGPMVFMKYVPEDIWHIDIKMRYGHLVDLEEIGVV